MGEISMWLDSYDDIYSDFDSRHYLKRRISEDFIEELKMSLRYRRDIPDVMVFLLPQQLRNTTGEKEIAASIQSQFHDRLETWSDKTRRKLRQSALLFILGLLIMALDSLVIYNLSPDYLSTVLRIVLEPAGWFMIWNGLDFLLYEYRQMKKEIDFYKAIGQLAIHFKNLE